jgi:hypothetical protein
VELIFLLTIDSPKKDVLEMFHGVMITFDECYAKKASVMQYSWAVRRKDGARALRECFESSKVFSGPPE